MLDEVSLDVDGTLIEEMMPPGLTTTPVHKKKKYRSKTDKEVMDFVLECFDKKAVHRTEQAVPIGKMLTLINYDELFERSLDNGAKIINDDIMTSPSVADEINNAIFSNNDGDLGFTSTCECGLLKGNYYEGATCPRCRTKVSTAFADKLSHTCWIAIPDSMPPVLHPIVYMVLRKWSTFKINEKSILDFVLDPDAEMPEDLKEVFPKQGFTYFYENYEYVLNFLLNEYPKTATKSSTELVRYFLNKYKSLLFCRKLPVLHNSLHVITKAGTIRCVDNSVRDALKTALNIAYASFTYKKSVTHDKFIDTSLYTSFQGYVSYVANIGKHKLGDKYALFRHHLLGCRCHWSCRAVIVPHITPMMADELILPWKIMVQSLKLELLNYMVNDYGLTPTEAIYRHNQALGQYDEMVAEIMEMMIKTHPYGGLPILLDTPWAL